MSANVVTVKKHVAWILWGLLVCFGVSVVLTLFYGRFRDAAGKWEDNPYEQTATMEWLHESIYLLWQDLYNAENGTWLNYAELYLKPEEGHEQLLDPDSWSEDILVEMREGVESENPEEADTDSLKIPAEILENETLASQMRDELQQFDNYFESLENNFVHLNRFYDYFIRNEVTGEYLTNMSEQRVSALLRGDFSDCFFLIGFSVDGAGNVSIRDVKSQNEDRVRKNANIVVNSETLASILSSNMKVFSQFGSIVPPRDCTVIYAISETKTSDLDEAFYIDTENISQTTFTRFFMQPYFSIGYTELAYLNAGLDQFLLLFLLGAVLLGMFLPIPGKTKPWKERSLFLPCLELLVLIGFLAVGLMSAVIHYVVFCASGMMEDAIGSWMGISSEAAWVLAEICNLAVLSVAFFPGWYLGVCLRAVPDRGIRRYIKEKSLIYRFFPFIKLKLQAAYYGLEHLDLTKNAHRMILRIVLVNALVLFVISSLWFGGLMITVIYSILLYLILRKYISNLQKKYSILLKATNEMAAGNLNVSIQEDIGVFEPFKPELIKIQNGFRKAVDDEVRSQKLKTELITNVSHDLKTPLTAIITYVNLLKEENTTEEQRREYLHILELKSLRLKALIEDLFEISKANSQNITLNLTAVDIMSLVKQVAFEMSDKIEAADLELRMNLTDEKVLISLDSQKTYRIYENLFGNIAKYAMKGTRVYVNGFRIDDTVVITLKNISAQELTVDSADLTERFVRGDASRNTEGSGLGLAIAKSFTELQGGSLNLELDGDLFKVITTWRVTEGNRP